jgi:hypothetical protein
LSMNLLKELATLHPNPSTRETPWRKTNPTVHPTPWSGGRVDGRIGRPGKTYLLVGLLTS